MKRSWRFTVVFGVLTSIFIVTSSLSQQQHFEPIPYATPADKLVTTMFPLTEISECDIPGMIFRSGQAKIQIGKTISIQNIEEATTHWNTSLIFAPALGCAIYQGDIDQNGTQDLIIVTFGGDSSGGYDTRLSLLLMDSRGVPFPWRTEGYFRATKQGIKEIAAGNDGPVIILNAISTGHQAWGGISYAYRLFHPIAGRVAEIRGSYAGMNWPLLPNANPDNKSLEQKILGSNRNVISNSPLTASDASTSHIDEDFTNNLVISGITSSSLILKSGASMPLPEIAMFDAADRTRSILFEPGKDELAALQWQSFSVQIIGTSDRFEEGGPYLLWGKQLMTKP